MHRGVGWAHISWGLLGGLVLAGCSERTDPSEDPVAEVKEPYAIGAREHPESLVRGASRRLADNIGVGDIGKTFGVPDDRAPYPDTYWPFVSGGTDVRWNPFGRDPRTPIEKYMAITAPFLVGNAKAWEFWNHGPGVSGVKSWHGHCPGWTAAAITNQPIRHPVFAGPDGLGGITSCPEGAPGCVRFEIGDINALMAEVFLDGPTLLIGSTCGTPAPSIPRDADGRILKAGCAGVNPGTLLIAAVTLLRRYQIPFGIGAQNKDKTAEVWNQPTYQYHVNDFHPLTMAKAANLVSFGREDGPATSYRWNRAARGFAFLDLGLYFVGEGSPQVAFTSGRSSTFQMRVAAVLELDADASNPDASILGGEYLDIPSRHADRLSVPPFLWVSRGPGPEDLPLNSQSFRHNPFIRPSLVKRLIALGQQ